MDAKAGIKTVSFWLATLVTVVTYLLGSDVLAGGRDAQVASLVISALGAIGYTSYRAWVKKDNDTRRAWRTTEFWLSAAAALCAVLYASGQFGPGTGAGKALGAIVAILAAAGYGVQKATYSSSSAKLESAEEQKRDQTNDTIQRNLGG